MPDNLADALVWILRLALLAGIGWGAWLCIGDLVAPARPGKGLVLEHFATFALLVLVLFSTLGGLVHAG